VPIAVLRAETFYTPPPRLPADAWDQVPGAERVFRWMEYRMKRRLVPPTGSVDQMYFARINQNRWIADCICGSAASVSPADPRFACTECGWGWCALTFPTDVDAVEASLMAEPPTLRNWWNPLDISSPGYQPPAEEVPEP
jgi:hypothetical protein